MMLRSIPEDDYIEDDCVEVDGVEVHNTLLTRIGEWFRSANRLYKCTNTSTIHQMCALAAPLPYRRPQRLDSTIMKTIDYYCNSEVPHSIRYTCQKAAKVQRKEGGSVIY